MSQEQSPTKSSPRAELSEMLTVPEVAERLAVAAVTVRRLINAGDLSAHKVGRVIRIPADSVDAFLRSSSTAGCSQLGRENEQVRLAQLDFAVRNYLSHLWAYEQGSDYDGPLVEYWREQMQRLTGDDDE